MTPWWWGNGRRVCVVEGWLAILLFIYGWHWWFGSGGGLLGVGVGCLKTRFVEVTPLAETP